MEKFIAKTRSDVNQFFNGDTAVNPRGFDGLRKRLIGRQVVDAKGVGPVASGYDFFDALDALTAQVRGITGQNGALYMNAAILAKIRSGFRRLGGAELLTAEIHGKKVTMWNGIPMLDPGQKLDSTDVLPLTAGTGGQETGDIYAVRFGSSEADAGVSGLTNDGVQATDLGEAHDEPVYRTRIEFYCGIALFGGKSAARLTNALAGRPAAPQEPPHSSPSPGRRVRGFRAFECCLKCHAGRPSCADLASG